MSILCEEQIEPVEGILEIDQCGDVLTSSSGIFSWTDSQQTPATGYSFTIGSTFGGSDIFDLPGGGAFSGNTVSVSGLPTDGRTLYKTLIVYRDGQLQGVTDVIRCECTAVGIQQNDITLSDCGGTLTGSTNTFTVIDNSTNIPSTRRYDLWIDDGTNFYDTGASIQYPSNTIVVTDLPVDGRTITKYLYYWDDPNNPPSPAVDPQSGDFITCTCTTANIQNLDCMTFTQIRETGRLLNSYPVGTVDWVAAHEAEFLYMHPDVSNWEVNGEEVCSLPDLEPSVLAFQLPPPSGNDDSAMIENAINANAEVVGTGQTYQLNNTVGAASATKIFNVPTQAAGNLFQAYNITTSNVEFYNSPVDGNNAFNFHVGFNVGQFGDNFVLSRSGVKNILTATGIAAGVWLRGADNFKITCNEFNDLMLNGAESLTGVSSSVLAVLNSGSGAMGGGYIANNNSENIHARLRVPTTTTTDPEFYKQQDFDSTPNRVNVIANRIVNGGKRMVKAQVSNVFAASNFYHWRDRQGPFGTRKQQTVIGVQLGSDNVRAINNRIKIEGEARYDSVITVNRNSGSGDFDDIHFDCNDIELIDVPPANFYAYGMYLKTSAVGTITNSTMEDNVWRGPGGTNHLIAIDPGFGGPLPPAGVSFSGNIEQTPVLISDYRGSGANYVP